MALAVNQNRCGQREKDFGVFTIEKDGEKVAKAKSIWEEAGEEVENCIDVREGDVLAVLEQGEILPLVVDLVFLDGKYYPLRCLHQAFGLQKSKHGRHSHSLH
jgi:predicted O-methyltransferase YrrM